VVGCGGRGNLVMSKFLKSGTVEVAALCDVWGDRIERAKKQAPEAQGYGDHRKLIERKDIDAVLVATPDH